jgi:hypothetical protein
MFTMVKNYFCYLAWEKKYNSNTQTFQQIIIQEYLGNIDEAIEFYLMRIIKNIHFCVFVTWIYDTNNFTFIFTKNERSQLYIIIKKIVMYSTLNEIKEIIEMSEICIK